MAQLFLTGGHAATDSWLICHAAEFPDEGEGQSTIFFVQSAKDPMWQSQPWDNSAVASCDVTDGPGASKALAVLSDHGVVSISNRNGIQSEAINLAGLLSPGDRGYMSDLREIDGALYACGMGGQLYRRIGQDDWADVIPDITREEADRTAQVPTALDALETGQMTSSDAVAGITARRDFASLGAGADGTLLLTGSFGLLAQVKGGVYQEIRLPEAAQMTRLHMAGPDKFIAHGWSNQRVYVYEGNFEAGFSLTATLDDIGNAAPGLLFKDTLYLGSKEGLFRVQDGVAVRVGIGGGGVSTIVKASENVMWVIGHYDVLHYAGDTFERIAQPA